MSKHHYLIAYDTDTHKWDWQPNLEIEVLPKSIERGGVWYDPEQDKELKAVDEAVSKDMDRGIRFLNFYESKYNRQVKGQ
jgi:hypothetical protein